jgi:hypothetical protein
MFMVGYGANQMKKYCYQTCLSDGYFRQVATLYPVSKRSGERTSERPEYSSNQKFGIGNNTEAE